MANQPTTVRFGAIIECTNITPGIPLTRVAMALQELVMPSVYESESGDLSFTIKVLGIGDDPRMVDVDHR